MRFHRKGERLNFMGTPVMREKRMEVLESPRIILITFTEYAWEHAVQPSSRIRRQKPETMGELLKPCNPRHQGPEILAFERY